MQENIMSLYDNAVCPVCHNPFEEGDDVVFCPECGTPHHRECYSLAGHCANEGLHKSGYSFYEDNKKNNPAPETETAPPEKEQPLPAAFPPLLQAEIPKSEDFKNEKIGEHSVGDISAAVRTNFIRFVSVFKRLEEGRKTSWNWCAFFFGAFYFFFRKMYKQGISFLSAAIAVIIGSNYAMLQFAPKASEAMAKASEIYAAGNGAQTSDFIDAVNALNSTSDIKTALTISYITMAIILLIHVIEALFADRFYKARINEIINKASELIAEGASAGMLPLSPSGESLNDAQLKQMYLARQGGTSIFAPIIAFFVMQMIFRLIAMI